MNRIKARTARTVAAAAVLLVVLLGIASKTGYGTACSLGTSWATFTCPLGFLQLALADRTLLPQVWLSVGLVLLSVLVLGRFFCAWVCPTALLRIVFGRRPAAGADKSSQEGNSKRTVQSSVACSSAGGATGRPASQGADWRSYSRYAVLGGSLVSSFLFGFPVFCVVCPVGLFFGSLFALNRLFSVMQPSYELLLFPALLGIELIALRSWCRSICPLGALLSVLSGVNRVLRPSVRAEACLETHGISCRACERACPEGIALVQDRPRSSLRDCTKCLECYEKCPAKAIEFGRG